MNHPFDDLKAEYAGDMAHMVVTRALDVDRAAKRILEPRDAADARNVRICDTCISLELE